MEILIILFLSFAYRKYRNKPIFFPSNDDLMYQDKWVSGHSFNLFQAVGGARNCLWIEVNNESVSIAPHFPFCLLFLPEIWGCEWHFKKADIIKIEESVIGVVITFKRNGDEKQFKLYPSNRKKFIQAASA